MANTEETTERDHRLGEAGGSAVNGIGNNEAQDGSDSSATTGTTAPVEGTQPEILDTQGFDGMSALMTDGGVAAKSVSSSEGSVCEKGAAEAGSDGASKMGIDTSRSTCSSVSILTDLMEYHEARFGYCETPLDAIQLNKLNGVFAIDNFHYVKYLNDDLLEKSGLLQRAMEEIAPKTEEERKMKGNQSGLVSAFLKKKFNTMRDYFVQKVKLSVVSGGCRKWLSWLWAFVGVLSILTQDMFLFSQQL